MVARNDGEHYGKLRVYRLPRQSLVYGPRQIENRINQDTEISRQVSLWDQRGSQVIRGELLVIPIEEALLYVQPLYLQADGGRIPELKRVIVAYGTESDQRVVMRETFDGALAALFGDRVDAPESQVLDLLAGETPEPGALGGVAAGGASNEMQALISDARRRYEAAVEAQRQGDWTRYGEELRQLGTLLDRLEGMRGGTP
jgi:uncharacterized membrane protein (UPF0182 family)